MGVNPNIFCEMQPEVGISQKIYKFLSNYSTRLYGNSKLSLKVLTIFLLTLDDEPGTQNRLIFIIRQKMSFAP